MNCVQVFLQKPSHLHVFALGNQFKNRAIYRVVDDKNN